jgi:hypothetical protein
MRGRAGCREKRRKAARYGGGQKIRRTEQRMPCTEQSRGPGTGNRVWPVPHIAEAVWYRYEGLKVHKIEIFLASILKFVLFL